MSGTKLLLKLLPGFIPKFEMFKQRKNRKALADEEWVPLVNEEGKLLGQSLRSKVHNGSKLLHPVVHMQVLNRNQSILLQKRPETKLIQPGKWDTAVGGHISAGESIEQALQKEAWEEIGLKGFSARLLQMYKWESEVEAELVYLFVTHDFKNYHVHSDEVTEARFWTTNQIEKHLNQGVFTPNFEHEFQLLKDNGLI